MITNNAFAKKSHCPLKNVIEVLARAFVCEWKHLHFTFVRLQVKHVEELDVILITKVLSISISLSTPHTPLKILAVQ